MSWRGRGGRTAALLAAAAAALLCAPPRSGAQMAFGEPVHADAAVDVETGLFQVQVGSLAPATLVVLVDEHGDVHLPVEQTLRLAEYVVLEVDVERGDVRVATGADAEPIPGGIDSVRGRLHVAGMRRADDGAFAPASEIARALDASVRVDWRTLTVGFTRASPFPGEHRTASARRRARLDASTAVEPRSGRVPFRARTGGFLLDWEITSVGLEPGRNLTVRPVLGTALFGGGLTLGVSLALDADGAPRALDPTATYRRVFPHSSLVRQVHVGHLFSDAGEPRSLTGFKVTNDPAVRAPVFDEVAIAPHVPAGWSYELYQGERLVGFRDPVDRVSAPVELRYGPTPLRMRLLGPAGETIERELVLHTPYAQVPAGEVRYAAGLGACRFGSCAWQGYGWVRHGVTPRLTLGWGLDVLRPNDVSPAGLRPGVVASYTSGGLLTAELQAQRAGLARGTVQLHPSMRLSLHASAARVPGSGATRGLPARWQADAAADLRNPQEGSPIRSVRLAVRGDGRTTGLESWRIGGTAYHAGGTLEASLEEPGASSHRKVGVRATRVLPKSRWVPLPGSVAGGLLAGRGGSTRVFAGASLAVRPWLSVGTDVRWSGERRHREVALSLAASRGSSRLSTRASTAAAGRMPAVLTLRGGVAPGEGDLAVHATGAVGTARVRGRVFFDRDGDGLYGGGDSAVAGAHVRVGGVAVRADRHGRYVAGNVLPYEVVAVSLEPGPSVPPNWTPARSEERLRPAPNVAAVVDVPLVRTREVSGRVAAASGVRAVGGVVVELVPAGGGEAVSVVTHADGEWYVPRLRPGRYEVRASAASLRALGAVADPASVEVPAGDGEEEVAAGTVELRAGP